ncbi:MAG: hypothetical protein IPF82_09380 [Blastocatellia bacterium]|nr:hypothetical protein [Blastocatellia bacterium]
MIAAKRQRRDNSGVPRASLVGSIHVDGDAVRVLVAMSNPDHDTLIVVSCREGSRSELPVLVDEAVEFTRTVQGSAQIEWITSLTGDEVLHDVLGVPPQVRSFEESVRLDAVLAGSRWGNVAAVSASGYTVGHAFRGDQCLLAVARTDSIRGLDAGAASPRTTTDAFGLLALIETVRPDRLEPSAGATLAMMCFSTSVAACAISDGRVRLLHQASLLDRMRTIAPAAATSTPVDEATAPAELEFEFAGSYSMPAGTKRAQPAADLRAADVESSAYQSTLLHLVDEVLGLASESEPFSPDVLLVTGEAVHPSRCNCVPPRVLRLVGRNGRARLGACGAHRRAQPRARTGRATGAICRRARNACRIHSGEAPDPSRRRSWIRGLRRRRRRVWEAIPDVGRCRSGIVAFVVALLVIGGGIGAARWLLVARRHDATAARLESELQRQRELNAIAAEWKTAEVRLAHTRSLLETIHGHRVRQQTPPRLLSEIRSLLPADVRLTEVSFGSGVVKLAGYCEARDIGPTLALAMEKKRESFADVTPQTNTATMKLPGPDTDEEVETSVHTFTITANYTGGPNQ